MIRLKEIDWNNFWDVVNIKVKDNQVDYLPPVSVFMAQSYVNLKNGDPDVSLAIYNNDLLIGFTKIVYIPKDGEPYKLDKTSYMIDAVAIDEKFQGLGYGKLAFNEIISFIKKKPFGDAETISLVCKEENVNATRMYEKNGFVKNKKTSDTKYLFLRDID
ncbi:GNAT family N-acetyltransferase [Breznakia pachnodae]|uniref:Diamine N-acetyltransferase n=1 Tax=Breznakia pachnodae TaxID=265178 RepID=A0ABU0E3D3_9FIRM|nr:GNAT family N-acetyltransferase [Breznakia pachnodae]MDQ0361320.1 diamine N-acetyltransferase [Breznakia pachnodae]